MDLQTTDSQFVEFLTYSKASVEVCHGPSHTSVGVQVSSGTLDISETARRMKVLQAQLDIGESVRGIQDLISQLMPITVYRSKLMELSVGSKTN